MPVDKITISLPEGLVNAIDEISQAEGVSRSQVVREAAELYVSDRTMARELACRREAAERTLSILDELRGRAPRDARSTLDILREARGALDEDASR